MSSIPITTAEPAWKKNLTDYNEGLGVVYERIVLNEYLSRLCETYKMETVLEAPIYGMAGVSGINSVPLAQAGCGVTLIDYNADRLSGVERIWGELGLETKTNFVHLPDMRRLPFGDNSFDMAWAWAALWYLPDAATWLREMARVARKIVFVAMPNRMQVGYILRKFVLEPNFFNTVNESWANIPRVKKELKSSGLHVVDEGVMDIPPWPDTVMPASLVLQKLGIRSQKMTERFEGKGWRWSTMDYYTGKRPELKPMMERLPLPWQLKAVWAHHRYVLVAKHA